MNYRKQETLETILELLETPEFRATEYPKEAYPEFEKCNYFGDVHLVFDDLVEGLDRIPSQTEFVAEGFKVVKAYFRAKGGKISFWSKDFRTGAWSTTFIPWSDRLEKALKHRLSRTYRIHLVEYSALVSIHQLFPECWTATDGKLDLVMGIDIVLGDSKAKELIYFHVTENSYWGKMWKTKDKRDGYLTNANDKKIWWERDFSQGHIGLLYDLEDSETTKVVNGNVVFKKEYLKSVIDDAFIFGDTEPLNRDCQLFKFHNFLIGNGLSEYGIKYMFNLKKK